MVSGGKPAAIVIKLDSGTGYWVLVSIVSGNWELVSGEWDLISGLK